MIFGNANNSQCLNRLENGCKRIIKSYCGGDFSVHVFFLRPPGIPVEAGLAVVSCGGRGEWAGGGGKQCDAV